VMHRTLSQSAVVGAELVSKTGYLAFVRELGLWRGKNSPRRVHVPNGWEGAVGGEGQTGQRPFRRERL